ncbi:NAD(P)H-quinone oxidoreductase [Tardiphaga sp. 768_D3_N2_1]|uniref:NAD(P)H-quinone oxidoreductase n=1 Tax=Tardiphaga sp. 768_D3_N2_1 TaxID=3240783 RepID=UPI003F8943A7
MTVLPSDMRAVRIARFGGPEVLSLGEEALPALARGEVLVRVVAAGVNRPDIQQRRGLYPPPPGATEIPGLDIAGIVVAVAPDVNWPRVGSAVCALVTGGGYAEYCNVPAVQCMSIPQGYDFAQAAVLPEVLFTCWNNVILLGKLAEGESILVQGGTSGVGMATIQIAKLLRSARVFATAGSETKRQICRDLGAEIALDYRCDWVKPLVEATKGQGINVILDSQAGPYTNLELELLALDGRLVLIASHLGERADINVRQIVRRRLTLTGSTIRPRPPEYKGWIAKALMREVWPLLEDRRMRLNICAAFPLEDMAKAHALMDANEQIGKVVLIVDPALAYVVPDGQSN